ARPRPATAHRVGAPGTTRAPLVGTRPRTRRRGTGRGADDRCAAGAGAHARTGADRAGAAQPARTTGATTADGRGPAGGAAVADHPAGVAAAAGPAAARGAHGFARRRARTAAAGAHVIGGHRVGC